ncbi:MAG: trypsin-like peptidase domain-containing protein [Verrucomicrobia bacterium]|nr:trypsin-like peptidase domain-containing protein [Verrucomicrobiota bacterium]
MKPLSEAELKALAYPSMVTVFWPRATNDWVVGSGFIISKNVIVTCAHSLINGSNITMKFYGLPDSERKPARVIAMDLENDLGLIHAETENRPPLSLYFGWARSIGDPVTAIGTPYKLEGHVTHGKILGLVIARNTQAILTDAPLGKSSSGGGLFNQYGQVVGVAGYGVIKRPGQYLAYSSEHVAALLQTIGTEINPPDVSTACSEWISPGKVYEEGLPP